ELSIKNQIGMLVLDSLRSRSHPIDGSHISHLPPFLVSLSTYFQYMLPLALRREIHSLVFKGVYCMAWSAERRSGSRWGTCGVAGGLPQFVCVSSCFWEVPHFHSRRSTPLHLILEIYRKVNGESVPMAIKKSELYSSLWKSCDELRGGMDASQYKD